MAFEKRDNSGALFKAKANENPKWPQYEGSAMIGGAEFYISAWVKEGSAGKFFSLAFKPKDGARQEPKASTKPAVDPDSEIPF